MMMVLSWRGVYFPIHLLGCGGSRKLNPSCRSRSPVSHWTPLEADGCSLLAGSFGEMSSVVNIYTSNILWTFIQVGRLREHSRGAVSTFWRDLSVMWEDSCAMWGNNCAMWESSCAIWWDSCVMWGEVVPCEETVVPCEEQLCHVRRQLCRVRRQLCHVSRQLCHVRNSCAMWESSCARGQCCVSEWLCCACCLMLESSHCFDSLLDVN